MPYLVSLVIFSFGSISHLHFRTFRAQCARWNGPCAPCSPLNARAVFNHFNPFYTASSPANLCTSPQLYAQNASIPYVPADQAHCFALRKSKSPSHVCMRRKSAPLPSPPSSHYGRDRGQLSQSDMHPSSMGYSLAPLPALVGLVVGAAESEAPKTRRIWLSVALPSPVGTVENGRSSRNGSTMLVCVYDSDHRRSSG
jgi:hypothetical protein